MEPTGEFRITTLLQRGEHGRQALLALAATGFLASALVYLYEGRWTVTERDYWRIYQICLSHSWLESALTKFNHQPLVFPSLIWLADLRFAKGNQELLFFAGMILLFLTALIILIPVWRDKTLPLVVKWEAILVVIVGNFWMGRGSITTSGGFNCICSLTIVGALMALLCLINIRTGFVSVLKWYLPVVVFAFIASFSFGTGLAIWPTLILLGWSLRLPRHSLGLIFVGGFVAVVVFILLPGASGLKLPSQHTPSLQLAVGPMVRNLCRLLGAPFLYVKAAWSSSPISNELSANSLLSFSSGVLGLIGAGMVVAPRIIRRDLRKIPREVIAIGLVLFNLFAMALIVIGRADNFRLYPFEVAAPRYMFWSSLFWTGLMLFGVFHSQKHSWLRWLVFFLALALPVAAFPSHYKDGVAWRYAYYRAESGATSLINDVRDPSQIVLFHYPEQVYRVAPLLRIYRLDMFAAGLQDWIGVREASLFGGHHASQHFKGQCHIDVLVKDAQGDTAARVMGWSVKRRHAIPNILVLVDSEGVVRGVARSSTTNRLISRIFYQGRFSGSSFLGYIRNYDPQRHYFVRCADDRILSDERIVVNGRIPLARGGHDWDFADN